MFSQSELIKKEKNQYNWTLNSHVLNQKLYLFSKPELICLSIKKHSHATWLTTAV